jgi:hypothetical protein
MSGTNDEHRARARVALAAYAASHCADDDALVQDLITDLLHVADADGHCIASVLRRAQTNFETETEGA